MGGVLHMCVRVRACARVSVCVSECVCVCLCVCAKTHASEGHAYVGCVAVGAWVRECVHMWVRECVCSFVFVCLSVYFASLSFAGGCFAFVCVCMNARSVYAPDGTRG